MHQYKVIAGLTRWLEAEFGSKSLTFRCDHATENKQEPAFYLERKEPGSGRGARIAQADIIGCRPDKKTVELIVEVSDVVNPSPKKVISHIVPYFLADNYTPSYEFDPYEMDQAVLFYLTLVSGKKNSQKPRQFQLIKTKLQNLLLGTSKGIRGVEICYGRTEDEMADAFKNTIGRYFGVSKGFDKNSFSKK